MAANDSSPASVLMDGRTLGMLIVLGLIWGGSFFFARIAVQEIAPMTLVWLRVSIAAGALLSYCKSSGRDLSLLLTCWRGFLLLGLVNNVIPFGLIFLGQTEIGAGLAAIVNATTPFWTALLANAVTPDEKLKPRVALGILVGIAGTIILFLPRLTHSSAPVWPLLAVLGATFSYAVAAIFAKRFKGFDPVLVATGQLAGSTTLLFPVMVATGSLFALNNVSVEALNAVIALALVATALAYILYFTIIARAGATNAALVTLIVPLSATLLGAVFLGERFGLPELLGMVVIMAGFVIIDGRLIRTASRR